MNSGYTLEAGGLGATLGICRCGLCALVMLPFLGLFWMPAFARRGRGDWLGTVSRVVICDPNNAERNSRTREAQSIAGEKREWLDRPVVEDICFVFNVPPKFLSSMNRASSFG